MKRRNFIKWLGALSLLPVFGFKKEENLISTGNKNETASGYLVIQDYDPCPIHLTIPGHYHISYNQSDYRVLVSKDYHHRLMTIIK